MPWTYGRDLIREERCYGACRPPRRLNLTLRERIVNPTTEGSGRTSSASVDSLPVRHRRAVFDRPSERGAPSTWFRRRSALSKRLFGRHGARRINRGLHQRCSRPSLPERLAAVLVLSYFETR